MNSDQRSAKTGRSDAVTTLAERRREPPPEEADARDMGAASEAARHRARSSEGARNEPGESRLSFILGGITAVAYVLLSLADGGFAAGIWAQAGVLVWWSVLVTILSRAWPRSRIPPLAAVAGLALFGLTVLTGASMSWASDPGAAFADTIRALGYLGVFVLAAIACRRGAGGSLLAGVTVGLVVLGALALISRLEPGFTGGVDEALALEVSGGRLSYPLGYWNAMGACMATALVLCVWLGAGAPTRGLRALALASIPIVVLSLFFSGSRGGVLAAIVGIAVLLVVGPRRVTLASAAALGLGLAAPLVIYAGASSGLVNGQANAATARSGDELLFLTVVVMAVIAIVAIKRDEWLGGLHLPVLGARRVVTALVIVGVLGALVVDPVTRLRALDAAPAETQLSAKQERTRFAVVGGSGRVQFWNAAIDAAEAEPLRGIGAGGFEYWWNVNRDLDVPVTHAHSLFLESAAEVGLFGALLALIFFIAPVAAGVRRRLAPTAWADHGAAGGSIGAAMGVLAAGLLTASIEWTWDIPSTFVPVVLAVAVLTVSRARATVRRPAGEHRLRRGASGLAIAVVALAATAACGALFVSEDSLDRSRVELAAGNPRRALDAARKAGDYAPFSARPYEQIALAEQELGHSAEANRALGEAQERADLDWTLWFVEAGNELRDGNTGEGTYALNQAEALNPRAPARLFTAPSVLATEFFRRLARESGVEYDAGG
ncbi:MAG: O-antigen ligase family protein [Solirubrobacterales bacterium]